MKAALSLALSNVAMIRAIAGSPRASAGSSPARRHELRRVPFLQHIIRHDDRQRAGRDALCHNAGRRVQNYHAVLELPRLLEQPAVLDGELRVMARVGLMRDRLHQARELHRQVGVDLDA